MSPSKLMPESAPPFDPGRRNLSIAAVVASTFGVGIAYGVGYPLTALTFERWGAPAWLTGLVGSAPALAIFLLLPFFPRLVARLGAVPSMTLGCGLVAGGFLLMPVFPSPEAWLVLRFLMGAGLALPWLVGETWINTLADDTNRGRMIALYSMALFGGFALGPVLLGWTGTEGWAPFLTGAGGILLAVVPLVAAASLAPDMPAHPSTGVAGALRLAPVAMVAALVGGALEMTNFSMLPVWATGAGVVQADALLLLTAFLLGGIALQLGIGWVADRLSARRAAAGSGIVLAVLLATLPVWPQGWPLFVAVFVLGGLTGGLYTLGLASIGQTVRAQDLAVANAAFLIAYQAGAMFGPALGGAAMEIWAPHGLVAMMAVAALLGALVIGAMRDVRTA
jgi:MFS family permease